MVLCAFRCLISRHQILNLRSLNQIRGKILLSWKLRHFGGSRFLQSYIIIPTSPITHNEGMFFFYLTRAVIMSHICLICVICCV